MRHDVGVRELRENLAHWLDVAASGDDVVVSERGKAKARISSISGQAVLDELVRQGKVRPPTRPWAPLPPPIRVKGNPVSDEIFRGHGH